MIDLRSTYRASEDTSRIAIIALVLFIALAMTGTIFLSPELVLASVFGVAFVIFTFARPTWSLAALLWYLPFEPFLLKWIPDGVYIYARYASEGVIYLLALVALILVFTGKRRYTSTRIDLPFVLFVVVLLATALINFVPPLTAALGVRQILRFILLFFVVIIMRPETKWIKTVLYGLFLILAFQILLGYGQALFGEPLDEFLLPSEQRIYGEIQLTTGTEQFWDPGQRVFGTMGRYDQLGTWMAFLMLIIVSILYEGRLRKYRKPLGALLLFAILGIALTYSRSSWFGFLLGFLFITIWIKRDRRVMWVSGLTVGALALYLAFSGLVVHQLTETSDQDYAERFFEAFSYERWRSEYYGLGRLFWIVQTPTAVVPASAVFGHGPAMFGGGAVAALGNTLVYDEVGLPFGVYGTEGYIDNNWLSLWGETGTLGLGLYLWMYIGLFLACLSVWHRSRKGFTRALALGVAAAMLAVMLNAFLATFLEVRTLAPYLWVFGGLVIVMGEREKLLENS